jgi:hypothetical protein
MYVISRVKTFCTFTLVVSEPCAHPNMAVLFSFLMSYFPDMLLRYFLSDFEMVTVVPKISCVTSVPTFYIHCVVVVVVTNIIIVITPENN